MGFFLSVVNAEIPYIPTAKKAAIGYISPFIRPMVLFVVAFMIIVAGVIINRRFYMPESQLLPTSERTWGMIGFAFLAFIIAVRGIFAALEARKMKAEDPWDNVNLES